MGGFFPFYFIAIVIYYLYLIYIKLVLNITLFLTHLVLQFSMEICIPKMSFMANPTKGHALELGHFNCEASIFEKYLCKTCNFTTELTTVFKAHVKMCNFGIPISEAGMPVALTEYKCQKCDFETHFSLKWLEHVLFDNCKWGDLMIIKPDLNNKIHPLAKHNKTDRERNKIKWFKCDKCDFVTKHATNLKLHIINKHLESSEITWFGCGRCNYRGKTKSLVKQHVMRHHMEDHEIRWFECGKCEYKSRYKGTLQRHEASKHLENDEIEWFDCNKCSYRSKQKTNLLRHMGGIHREVPWLECETCEFKTRNLRTFKKHIMSKHSADSEIVCVTKAIFFAKAPE